MLDTRSDLGLTGPFTSADPRTLTVTGPIPTADGTQTVVPTHANAVALNVTVVEPATAGFISVRPGDATGTPSTSSLNFEAGETTPNAVTVAMPTTGPGAGQIEITFDAYGQIGPTTGVLVDVVGYTTTAGLDAIVADLAQKANATDVYTKAQTDAAFISHGPITMRHGNSFLPVLTDEGPSQDDYGRASSTTAMPHDGALAVSLIGPDIVGGVQYRLSSVEFCVDLTAQSAFVDAVAVAPSFSSDPDDTFMDETDRFEGCHTFEVDFDADESLGLLIAAGGADGAVFVSSARSTWVPVG